MVHLLRHGHPFASPARPRAARAAAQGGRAAASPGPAVHADEVEDDAEVAGEHRDDEHQQQRGVELQVRGASMPDETPRPRAVLGVLPVAQQRQGAEEQGRGVDGGQHDEAAAARDAALVQHSQEDTEEGGTREGGSESGRSSRDRPARPAPAALLLDLLAVISPFPMSTS